MAATAVDMAAMVVATDMAVATDTTARGLLMPSPRLRPRLSLAMATTDVATAMVVTVAVMAAMAVATTARGLLMPSLRLMPLLRLSPATATAVDTVAMAVTDMVVTVVVMVATAMARGLLSPATAMAGATATGVSYHRIRRSELSQKQNHKNSQR